MQFPGCRLLCFLISVLPLLAFQTSRLSAELRNWTRQDGAITQAYFLSLEDNQTVVLVTPKHVLGRVPIAKLVQEDQEYARRRNNEIMQALAYYNQGLAIMPVARIKAADLFEKGADLSCPHCYMQLGTLRAAEGKLVEAGRYLKKALTLSRPFIKVSEHHKFTYVASANNLGLLYLKQGRPASAAALIGSAGGVMRDTPRGLFHNMVLLSTMGEGDSRYRRAIDKMVSHVPPPTRVHEPELWRGWFFMNGERINAGQAHSAMRPAGPEDEIEGMEEFAAGSGFVIGDELILTSKHVVSPKEITSEVQIHVLTSEVLEDQTLRLFPAKVIAVEESLDLALLSAQDLAATPLPMEANLVPAGTSVTLLGFPSGNAPSASLMVNRGKIVESPSLAGKFYLLDGAATLGNSGGPVVDSQTGLVVGIIQGGHEGAPQGRDVRILQGSTRCVPSKDALAWLSHILPGQIPAGQRVPVPHQAHTGLGESVVQIKLLIPRAEAELLRAAHTRVVADRDGGSNWNGFFDTTCMLCNGLGHIKCPNSLCARGRVTQQTGDFVTSPTGNISVRRYQVKESCPRCGGSGRVDCPQCEGSGTDKRFEPNLDDSPRYRSRGRFIPG